MKAHGLMFHHFHDDTHIKEQGSISAKQLEEIIALYREQFNLLGADEFYYKTVKGSLKDNDVCLTFDDALLCQYDIAEPVLKNEGLTAFWFVYTSPLEGNVEKLELYRHFRHFAFETMEAFYNAFDDLVKREQKELGINVKNIMSEFNPKKYLINSPFYTDADRRFRYLRDQVLGEEKYHHIMSLLLEEYNYDVDKWKHKLWISKGDVKQLENRGNIIGLHSHSHSTILGKYSYEAQYQEYQKCKEILESFLQYEIKSVSYPCNSYNTETARIMNELGVELGFTANINDSNGKLFIPREDHANVIRNLDGRRDG